MHLPSVEQVLAVIGALSGLCTALAMLFPKGSKTGAALARVGADLKGHNVPAAPASVDVELDQ